MTLTQKKGAALLLHNPSCSKSRQLKQALDERGAAYETRKYLDEPLSKKELGELLDLLGLEPHALLRTKEKEYEEAGLSATSSKKAIVDAIAQFPRLMERPILVVGAKAAIGRPTEAALALVGG
ncbi:MAG: ArsC/Spx/MgsR family protein [Planctomycetota bacterium]